RDDRHAGAPCAGGGRSAPHHHAQPLVQGVSPLAARWRRPHLTALQAPHFDSGQVPMLLWTNLAGSTARNHERTGREHRWPGGLETAMADAVAGKVAPPEEQQLKKGVLTTWDALALSIAVIAPAMAASYNTSGSAAVSGGSTPLCFLIAGLSSLALAYVVIQFTRRMASAGYAYTYTTKS